jgi:hypothetical protein
MLPAGFTASEICQILADVGVPQKVEILRTRVATDSQTAFVTFDTVDQADLAVRRLNYRDGILVSRFTDEQHWRFMRSYQLVVRGVTDPQLLRRQYEPFGELFQAWIDSRFDVGLVQFYEKNQAVKVINENATFIADTCVLIFRDLSFDVTDEQILELCRPFGTIQYLLTRDINDMMRFLIKEVTFASPDEAKRAKKSLSTQRIGENAVRTAILNGGHIEAFDWKLAQRKQWVRFKDNVAAVPIFEGCRQKGQILDVRVIDNDTFVMFAELDAAQSVRACFGAESPSMIDFVEKLNSDELNVEMSEFNGTDGIDQPRKMAIVVDDLPLRMTKEQMVIFCGEFAEGCVVHVLPSLRLPGRLRAIVYPKSKSTTNKVYQLLNEVEVDAARLKPVRMKRDDVMEPPDISDLDKIFVRPERLAAKAKLLIAVDPIPDEWTKERIIDLCAPFPSFTVRITRSAIEQGRKRALIRPMSARAKKHIFKLMNGKVDGVKLNALIYTIGSVPRQLGQEEEESSDDNDA